MRPSTPVRELAGVSRLGIVKKYITSVITIHK